MHHLGFTPCKADPDVWMRPASKASNNAEYWEFVLLYVDDALCISMRPEEILRNEIRKYWTMKKGSIGPHDIYLGNKVSKVTLENGVDTWAFSSSQYVQAAVANVEKHLSTQGLKLPNKAATLFVTNYRPEIDISPELGTTDAA